MFNKQLWTINFMIIDQFLRCDKFSADLNFWRELVKTGSIEYICTMYVLVQCTCGNNIRNAILMLIPT